MGCIGVEGNSYSSGTPIEIQDCVGGSTDQEWTYEADGTVKSVANPLYCWDENSIGSDVYLWTCDGSSDQYWIFNSLSSSSPVASPTSQTCTDTTLRFKVDWNGRIITRDCTWVSNRATIQRCNIDGVSKACSETCGTCSSCIDSTLRIKVPWNGRIVTRDCIWVGNRATIQRCNVAGVADACPSTCGVCTA